MKTKTAITPRNFIALANPTGNIYESTVIIAKRSKQIALKTKEELNDKLAEFASQVDNLEEVFENKEHIEISKFYEKQPKPAITATEEFLADKLMRRYAEVETSSVS
ncbi:MAG: DNA-directed RNA polymerase subunit omega [Bacteroidota bacterium]